MTRFWSPGRRPGRAHARRHQQEVRSQVAAQHRDLVRRAHHAIEAAGFGEGREAAHLVGRRRRAGRPRPDRASLRLVSTVTAISFGGATPSLAAASRAASQRGAHHRRAAGGVQIEDHRLQRRHCADGAGDGVGDVVELEVEEQRRAERRDLRHARRTARVEEFQAELDAGDRAAGSRAPSPWPPPRRSCRAQPEPRRVPCALILPNALVPRLSKASFESICRSGCRFPRRRLQADPRPGHYPPRRLPPGANVRRPGQASPGSDLFPPPFAGLVAAGPARLRDAGQAATGADRPDSLDRRASGAWMPKANSTSCTATLVEPDVIVTGGALPVPDRAEAVARRADLHAQCRGAAPADGPGVADHRPGRRQDESRQARGHADRGRLGDPAPGRAGRQRDADPGRAGGAGGYRAADAGPARTCCRTSAMAPTASPSAGACTAARAAP